MREMQYAPMHGLWDMEIPYYIAYGISPLPLHRLLGLENLKNMKKQGEGSEFFKVLRTVGHSPKCDVIKKGERRAPLYYRNLSFDANWITAQYYTRMQLKLISFDKIESNTKQSDGF